MMTREELRAAREALGLTQAQLGARLELGGDGGRTVRRWELGERSIPGPVSVLVRLWLYEEGLLLDDRS